MKTLLRRSTDEVAPAQRVRHWRDAVHASVVEMDLRPSTSEAFHSHIELCRLANIVPHQAGGSPQTISRGPSDIARGVKNAYYLISQPQRAWHCEHAGQVHGVAPGESVLVDSRIPYAFRFDNGFDDLSVEMPVAWLERWIPEPARVIGRPLRAAEGWGLALRGAKEALLPSELVRQRFPDELIEDQLGALLALATGSQIEAPAVGHDVFDACTEALRGRLGTPGLVAADVARDCAISLRTLHRVFASNGRTFAGVLAQARIDLAARLLTDRRFRHLSIAEIGRRCGFLDPSHFARQFRRLHAVGPREYRSAAGR